MYIYTIFYHYNYMNVRKKKLLLEQADRKLEAFQAARFVQRPLDGWIHTIRTGLGMTLQQLGNRLGKTASHIKALETNEKNQTITLQSLHELAKEIVHRSATTMELEDQGSSREIVEKAIKQKQQELQTEMPKHLWD